MNLGRYLAFQTNNRSNKYYIEVIIIKTIKRISIVIAVLFSICIIFILFAAKFDWDVNPSVMPIFFLVILLTALSLLVVSMHSIFKIVERHGILYFGHL